MLTPFLIKTSPLRNGARMLLAWMLTAFCPTWVWSQEQPAPEEIVVLEPFSVEAIEDASGYGVTSATSMTRLNTALRDIPQTVNIVTSQFMKELAASTLGEAVALMPNVTGRAGSPDRLQVRSIDVYSQFRNGFRYQTGRTANFVKDLTNIDRIEIIKGLGSATTGRGEAGGVVNLITKKPQAKRASSIRFTVDEFSYNKTEFDTTGPLDADGKILYRAIGSYTGGETYSPNDKFNLFSFYPSLEFRITDRTNLLIEASIQTGETPSASNFEIVDNRSIFKRDSNGLPVSNGQPPGALAYVHKTAPYTQPATLPWIEPDAQLYEVTTSLNHKFNDWLSTRQAVLLYKSDVDREYTRLNGQRSGEAGWVFAAEDTAKLDPIDIVSALRWDVEGTDTEFISYQGDVLMEFETASMTNQTLFGYEYTSRDIFTKNFRSQNNGGYRVFDNAELLSLQKSDLVPLALRKETDVDIMETSFYVQHTTKLLDNRLQIVGGWRYDKIEEDLNDLKNNKITISRPEPTDKTFRFGGSYRITPWMTAFAVHAEQSDPSRTVLRYPAGNDGITSRDPSETVSAARTVELNEIGIKSELLDGRLTMNVTYYDILEGSNIRFFNFRTNPDDNLDPLHNWSENVVDPEGISRGWEIEVMGAPTDRLSFYASASFPTNETQQAIQADGSIRTSFRRGHSDARLNFAGNFLVTDTRGTKVYAQTAFGWTDDVVWNPDNAWVARGSLRWDLGVRLVRELNNGGAWEAQLRMQNVLDQQIVTGTSNSHTSPRRLSLSIERSF